MLKAHTLLIEVGQAVQPSVQPRPSTLAHLRTYAEVPGVTAFRLRCCRPRRCRLRLGDMRGH